MCHVYLDAMGGDNAPECTVNGALEALRENADLRVTLAGTASVIEPMLKDAEDVRDRITVEDTSLKYCLIPFPPPGIARA